MYVKGDYDFKYIKPLSVIGVFLIRTAIDSNPSETRGLDGALAEIVQQPFGPWILGAFAIWIYRERLMHNKRRPSGLFTYRTILCGGTTRTMNPLLPA